MTKIREGGEKEYSGREKRGGRKTSKRNSNGIEGPSTVSPSKEGQIQNA